MQTQAYNEIDNKCFVTNVYQILSNIFKTLVKYILVKTEERRIGVSSVTLAVLTLNVRSLAV